MGFRGTKAIVFGEDSGLHNVGGTLWLRTFGVTPNPGPGTSVDIQSFRSNDNPDLVPANAALDMTADTFGEGYGTIDLTVGASADQTPGSISQINVEAEGGWDPELNFLAASDQYKLDFGRGGFGGQINLTARSPRDGTSNNDPVEININADGDSPQVNISTSAHSPGAAQPAQVNIGTWDCSLVLNDGAAGQNLINEPGIQLTAGDQSIWFKNAKLGFFGIAPVDQPAHPVTLADVINALAALGLTA